MDKLINVYCDESCHLEHDGMQCMVLGSVWVKKILVSEIAKSIKEIKAKHGIKPHAEIKWTGISKSKLAYYIDLINLFFDCRNLHYRGLVIPDKKVLNHDLFCQTHDDFYYKMYFNLLKTIWHKDYHYRVFVDIKDTNGAKKVRTLEKVLRSDSYDFDHKMIEFIQLIRSHESTIMQLTDLISGAISYINRGLETSEAKLEIVKLIQKKSGYSLQKTTYLSDDRFNLLIWKPEESV